MNKEELRDRYIKEIPKQVIQGEQLSYADWLEQFIVSRYGINENTLLQDDSNMLPNQIDLGMLANLLKYSDRYERSIQFWPDQTAVYICKDDVELKDFGGSFEFAVGNSIVYLDRITGNER